MSMHGCRRLKSKRIWPPAKVTFLTSLVTPSDVSIVEKSIQFTEAGALVPPHCFGGKLDRFPFLCILHIAQALGVGLER
jgi:hypothetical protein